ncbi:MAG TPA: glycosyltransferase family 1 protein [Gemmatimonadaceae bacterium]|nr:glycosyltransferase family 1 protein [Gemmatimonadaceae bacterium]
MLVGVDGTCWSNERGYGRFAREIVDAMVRLAPQDEFVCFVDRESADRFTITAPNARSVLVESGTAAARAASAGGYRSPLDMLAMTRAVARTRLEVFFSPSVYTFFPLPPRLRAVVTIHDAIAERFPALTLPSLRSRLFWALKVRLALHQATRILTVSDYAAIDVERVHRVPRSRIDVATEAAAPAFQPRDPATTAREAEKRGIPYGARYFIYVGGFNPHKNIPSIIRAHASLLERWGKDAPHLVLVGTLDRDVFFGDLAATRAAIDAAGTAQLIHWTGFVPDDELSALNSGAIALLLPSAAEGFGLPAVEAAACRTPVIATVESPLPQLLEGGGLFVTPGDDRSLADAMEHLASETSSRESLASTALGRASLLTWERGAHAALGSLRSAAGRVM